MGGLAAFDDDIGGGEGLLARGGLDSEHVQRVFARHQGPAVAAPDPAGQKLKIGLEPNRNRFFMN